MFIKIPETVVESDCKRICRKPLLTAHPGGHAGKRYNGKAVAVKELHLFAEFRGAYRYDGTTGINRMVCEDRNKQGYRASCSFRKYSMMRCRVSCKFVLGT